jgi:hypothetical protein
MGVEPTTSCMPCKRSSQLSYIPMIVAANILQLNSNFQITDYKSLKKYFLLPLILLFLPKIQQYECYNKAAGVTIYRNTK